MWGIARSVTLYSNTGSAYLPPHPRPTPSFSASDKFVGASSLTTRRTHTILGDCVGEAHLRQRRAAEAGQPAQELVRSLPAAANGRPSPPMASIRMWNWAGELRSLVSEAQLGGRTAFPCVLCEHPKAAFIDGVFSPRLRDIAGGWSANGWSIPSTVVADIAPRLAAFDAIVHANGATLDGTAGECGDWTAAAEVGGAKCACGGEGKGVT